MTVHEALMIAGEEADAQFRFERGDGIGRTDIGKARFDAELRQGMRMLLSRYFKTETAFEEGAAFVTTQSVI